MTSQLATDRNQARPAGRVGLAPQRLRPRVLVVDDSRVIRAVVSQVLRGAGFEVLEARDGVEGAVVALRERPTVVVTDLEMPLLGGFPLLRLLKADPATAHASVLILTSHEEAESRFWGLETGADAYLSKTSAPAEIAAVVSRLAAAAPPPAASGGEPPAGAQEVLARVARQLDACLLEATLATTLLERGLAAADLAEAAAAAAHTLGEAVDAYVLGIGVAAPESTLVHLSLEETVSDGVIREVADRLVAAIDADRAVPLDLQIHGRTGSVAQVATSNLAVFPLPLRGTPAALAVLARDPDHFAAVSRSLVAKLVGPVALVVDNARLYERLHELSTVDDLTRLLNRRTICARLSEELERARRFDLPVTVLLLDLDHFKEINDHHGHLAGDRVLREVATLLQGDLRSVDLLGRYGGEELLAVLPQTGLEDGLGMAERLRARVARAATRLPGGESLRATASFGLACRDELGEEASCESLLALADRRLYEAKASGRNCVRPAPATREPRPALRATGRGEKKGTPGPGSSRTAASKAEGPRHLKRGPPGRRRG